MKIINIFSLKYAPGLYKEFTLLGDLFKKESLEVNYFLSKGYMTNKKRHMYFISDGIGIKGMIKDLMILPKIINSLKKFFNKKNNICIFYNPHPINFLIQIFLKHFLHSKVVIILHEPYKTFQDKIQYGLKGFVFFSIVNFLQSLSIKFSDYIVTVSPYGKELFINKYKNYEDKLIEANLLLEDKKFVNVLPETDRKYFSYIGRVNKGKGIDDFINAVNYSIEHNLNINFLIITSSNIDKYIKKLLPGYRNKLKIINKSFISDKEIDEVIVMSKAVLILHQTASQSGVFPLCCKYETPVICRNIKAFSQYFDNNGVLLNEKFKERELISACELVDENFNKYSYNAKKIFDNYFSEKNFKRYYNKLL